MRVNRHVNKQQGNRARVTLGIPLPIAYLCSRRAVTRCYSSCRRTGLGPDRYERFLDGLSGAPTNYSLTQIAGVAGYNPVSPDPVHQALSLGNTQTHQIGVVPLSCCLHNPHEYPAAPAQQQHMTCAPLKNGIRVAQHLWDHGVIRIGGGGVLVHAAWPSSAPIAAPAEPSSQDAS